MSNYVRLAGCGRILESRSGLVLSIGTQVSKLSLLFRRPNSYSALLEVLFLDSIQYLSTRPFGTDETITAARDFIWQRLVSFLLLYKLKAG